MKRTLLLTTAVLVALSMFFAACQDPVSNYSVSNTDKLEYQELPGPEWVRAEAVKGANIVTWAFVKDAAKYTVYRQLLDEEGKPAPKSPPIVVGSPIGPNSDLYVVDAVAKDNQLVDGASYVYSVITGSEASLFGRAVQSTHYVKDGVTSAEPVKAIIPAYGTVVTALTDPALTSADITTQQIQKINGTDHLLVSWPARHPSLKYSVEYWVGGATLAMKLANASTPLLETSITASTLYQEVPLVLFGANTEIKLGVQFNNDEFYYKSATIAKEVPSITAETLLFSVDIDSVTRQTDPRIADIVWKMNAASLNPGDYKLYRIEISPDVTLSGTEPYIQGKVTVIGNWAPVTGTVKVSAANNEVTLTEDGLDPFKTYLYALYADIGGKQSAPKLYTLSATTLEVTPSVSLDVTPSYTTASDGTRTYSVALGWTEEPGATYALSRAVKTKYPTQSLSAFTPVTIPPTALVKGRYTLIDTPEIRHSYIYRLAKTANGLTTYSEKTLDRTNDAVFSEYVSLGLTAAASSGTAYAIEISLAGYAHDLTADIYRAEVSKNISVALTNGDYTDLINGAFAKIVSDRSIKDDPYLDGDLAIGTQYVYRVVYKLNGTELVNENASLAGNAGVVQVPSVPGITAISAAMPVTNGTRTRDYYTVTTGTSHIGARIRVEREITNTGTGVVSDWAYYATASTVATYANNSADFKWESVDTGVRAPSATTPAYYFYVDTSAAPTVPAGVSYQYRVVLDDSQDPATVLLGPSYPW